MSFRPAFLIPTLAIFFSFTACTVTRSQVVTPAVTPLPDHNRSPAQANPAFEKDRRAILAMLGEYEVTFTFRETVALKPGYERKTSKDAGAFETVVLVEDSGRKIVLQHLLVSKDGAHVIKHWRQDWIFEAPTRFEFTEDQTWRVKPIAAAITQAAWTQCVYEVNDAPRYCGTGKWRHDTGAPTWTSDPTWRPLPRREYTVRSDYNALNATNRHTITPAGWTHEQDNAKTVREGESTQDILVREFGFNEYRRITSFDFTPAYAYWNATKEYWRRVRQDWDERFAKSAGLSLKTTVDGMALIKPLFEKAENVRAGQEVTDAEIAVLFERWVAAPGATSVEVVTSPEAGKPSYQRNDESHL